nr:M50 family metallopeptidase [Thioalkalivibrio thiocyanodenitrificans]
MTYRGVAQDFRARSETRWLASIGWEDRRSVEQVAFHESGHAVMTLLVGRRLKEVAVTSPRSGNTREERSGPPVWLSAQGERKDPHVIRRLLDTIRILLAGPIADQEYSRARDLFEAGGSADLDKVAALLTYMEAALSHNAIHYQSLVDDVSDYLMSPNVWHYVTILAEALTRTPIMSGSEVVSLLAGAGKGRNQLSLFPDLCA